MAGTARIAWRNLGRNPRRTLLTGSALALGVALAVFSYGLVDGMLGTLLHSLTRFDLGHVQVHQRDYPESKALEDTVRDHAAVVAKARALEGVRGVSERLYAFALVAHAEQSLGVEVVGVDPLAEPRVTVLHDKVIDGRYLDSEPAPWPRGRQLTEEEEARDEAITEAAEEAAIAEIESLGDAEAPSATGLDERSRELTRALASAQSPPPERPPRVIVGDALARVLRLEVGSQLHAATQTVDGQSEEVFFEVAGIYHTGTTLYDRSRIYLNLTDLQRFTHLYDRVHEIAIVTESAEGARGLATALARALGRDDVLVRPWNAIRPDIEKLVATSEASMGIFVFIIFIVATLGVVNTMLMAVFERTRELGVLKALGMSGRRVVGLVVTESLFLVLVSAGVGTLFGLGIDLYLVEHGLDLTSYTSGFSMSGVGMEPVLYGAITARGLVLPAALLSTTCVLASLYPAIRAARLRPAIGMRET